MKKLAVIVLLVLAAARAALPVVVERMLNAKLAALEGWRGKVEDVDFFLLGGTAALGGLKVADEAGDTELSVPRLEADVSWKALLHGKLVASIAAWRPSLTTALAKKPAKGEKEKTPERPKGSGEKAARSLSATLNDL